MRFSKKDEFNLRHFYVQFSMSRLNKVDVEEENFISNTLFDFQRRLSIEVDLLFIEE